MATEPLIEPVLEPQPEQPPTPSLRDQARRAVELASADRRWFVSNLLGVTPDEWQEDILRQLDEGATRISVRSGHGVGKTALCAWLALHFLLFRIGVKVIVTSPSGRQMSDGIKPELRLWIDRLPRGLGLWENLEVTADRVVRRTDPSNNFVSFRTARIETPEALAGIHADHVMVIVDEASGVPEPVFEAASGTLSTAGAICLLIGNPTRARGLFYRTHTMLADLWTSIRVSSLESDRVDSAFIEDIRRTYGPDSNQFRVRVMGEFPTTEEDCVIPLELVRSSIDRDIEPYDGLPVYWGVDPGRGGDATGFCSRQGTQLLELAEWHDPDLMKIVGRIRTKWDKTPPSDRPEAIYIDAIGLGAGVADRLRELNLPSVDINVSEAPAMKDRYPRLRAELWFSARDWFEARNCNMPSAIPLVEKLLDELTAPEMRLLSNGKTDVESKADMRRRGMPSPNLADAFNLTLAAGGATAAGRGQFLSAWTKPIRSRYVGVA